jgi:hypothetical protein
MVNKNKIIINCGKLLKAYKDGLLGQTVMPEDSNPGLKNMNREERLAYFTLPMSLNYQRDSYRLWQAALNTFYDEEARRAFDISYVAKEGQENLREKLLKYKLALQPNKHINTWQTISKTVYQNWGSLSNLIDDSKGDFLKLKETIQNKHKKGFPYLSGAKIFNYWSFVLKTYGGVSLKNTEYIEIAPDTHITRCSVKLGVITQQEAKSLTKEEISERWREVLKGSGIDPIEMHPPLWFWSRNGFIFSID